MNSNHNSTKILISDRTNFKKRKVTEDKEGAVIMISRWIHQDDRMSTNIYVPKNIASNIYKTKHSTDRRNN